MPDTCPCAHREASVDRSSGRVSLAARVVPGLVMMVMSPVVAALLGASGAALAASMVAGTVIGVLAVGSALRWSWLLPGLRHGQCCSAVVLA